MPAGGETLAGKPARSASELTLRVLSALVMAAVVLGVTYVGGWAFRLLWLAAGLAVLFEWLRMTRVEPFGLLMGALSLILVAAALPVAQDARILLGLLAIGVLACLAVGSSWTDRGWAVAGGLYAAVLVVVPPSVRDPWVLFGNEFGRGLMFWIYGVVWATDIAGYFVGRAIGGPKLWPAVSPKKTWSGFLGGVLLAIVIGLVLAHRFLYTASAGASSWVDLVRNFGLAAVIASVVSQAGDLGESALKRRFDVKDSSHLIPGHGGLMDRLDGFWAVCALIGLATTATWIIS